MLRKYLVVLGCSGKWHRCWTTFCWFLCKKWCFVRGRHQMTSGALCICDHTNSILFSSFPQRSWMVCIFDSISFEAMLLGVVNISPPCLLCTFWSASFFPPRCFCILWVHSCISISTQDLGDCFLGFAVEPQQTSFAECDVIIKGSGCPFCYCVSFEMQTLQWIFLWAMNV